MNINDIEFVLLCGGKSTRNYPHSKGIGHKCLLPFGSMRLIDLVLSDIFKLGGRHITLVCSNETVIDSFKEALSPAGDVIEKLEKKGLNKIATAVQKTEIPTDADIKYVVQKKPLGTAHAIGLASFKSENRDMVVIFPDDIYINKNSETSHLKRMLDLFYQDPKKVVLMGIYQDDPTRFGILHNNRLLEKPNPAPNNWAVFSPIILPKAIVESSKNTIKYIEENGQLPEYIKTAEWYYTDLINDFLNASGHDEYGIDMIHQTQDEEYLDTGVLPSYEKALLLSLLKMSEFKDENRRFVLDLLKD